MTEDAPFDFAVASDIEAELDRMAGEVMARWPGEMVVVGIRRRGVPLAEALAERLEEAGTDIVAVQELELKRYSDELDVLHEQPSLNEPEEPLELEGRRVLLVDDVLYTGRTFARALDYVTEAGAEEVRCAVLAVRRGNELPIEPDVVGFRCDIGAGGIVDVRIPPYEDRWAVELRKRDEGAD
ncbi:MAG: phosphoribosyltransferase family protein [Longimicrobiales bacterium]